MATVSIQRVPFGEVGASRLQSLQSAKNTQNAITESLKHNLDGKTGKSFKDIGFQMSSPTKRPLSVFVEDNNSDSENVDPATVTSFKRSKTDDGPAKPSAFSLSMSKPMTVTQTLSSPVKRKHSPTPQDLNPTPASAPIDRKILKHKRVGILSNKSAHVSPFKRIDPPMFGSSRASAGSLPFSIDAALNGTISSCKPVIFKGHSKVSKSNKAKPKSWFFDIHEDTPDDQITIEMQHCTGILDLSSDDEQGPAQKRMKRGKENIPPPAPESADSDEMIVEVERPRVRARAGTVDVMVDDGDRSPLSDLAPEDYYGNGLERDSVAIVPVCGTSESAGDEATSSEHPEQEAPREQNEEVVEAGEQLCSPAASANAVLVDESKFVIAEDAEAQP